MKYLLPSDLYIYITQDSLNQITTSQNIINYAEDIALNETTSYITSRFDTDIMFRSYAGWTSSATYSLDERVVYQDEFYITKVDGASASNITNPLFFDKKDDRSRLLNICIIDIMIYHLLTTLDFSSVSEFRYQRYHNAIKKLKEYVKGTSTLQDVIYRDKQTGISIIWGSKYNDNYDINPVYSSNRNGLSASTFNTNPGPQNNPLI